MLLGSGARTRFLILFRVLSSWIATLSLLPCSYSYLFEAARRAPWPYHKMLSSFPASVDLRASQVGVVLNSSDLLLGIYSLPAAVHSPVWSTKNDMSHLLGLKLGIEKGPEPPIPLLAAATFNGLAGVTPQAANYSLIRQGRVVVIFPTDKKEKLEELLNQSRGSGAGT